MAQQLQKSARKVFKVSEITRLVRLALEREFGDVWIEGELSNVSQPASGHLYFTIKDEGAQIRGVMWRSDCRLLRFVPKDGLMVEAFGQISVYERGGLYQVVVRRMEEGGKGSLQAAFEALKEKLQAEGLFDAARKKPIPLLPRHIGVVTSPTGAAIRDILSVMRRRFPNFHMILAPVRVQGAGAAEEIAAAVDLFNEVGGVDVLIVGRGGGSLEDLWCFNEEVVARAIARSRIPVISAVGHEVDFTISDFVADLRAPTPSAAAEMVVGRKDAFETALTQASRRIGQSLSQRVLQVRNRLLASSGSYVFREPRNMIAQCRQRLGELSLRMAHELPARRQNLQQRAEGASMRLTHRMTAWLTAETQEVRRLHEHLNALNPMAVLARGYSITKDSQGRVIRSAAGIRPGERVTTRVAEGSLESEVTKIHDKTES